MNIFSSLRRNSVGPMALVGVLTLGLVACDDDDNVTVAPAEPTITELAANTPELSTLVQALQAAGLGQVLQDDGPYTVFAPVNSAFEALPAGTLDALLADGNAAVLSELLTFHVVPGTYTAGQLTNGARLKTAEGGNLRISVNGGVQVNGQNVVTADIDAGNGVVHLIDGVILDGLEAGDRAAVTPQLSTLAAAVAAADLGDALNAQGPFTVFAPVDGAFEGVDLEAALDPANREILTEILTYHVVPGVYEASELREGQVLPTLENSLLRVSLEGGATVNGIDVVATDIQVGNGVVHLIDGVLLEGLNVAQRATVTEGTGTLAAAVAAAGLGDALSQRGPITVFAPVDAAFDGVPVETLLDPGNVEILRDILTYHVVPGAVRAADLRDGQRVTTLEGNTLEIGLQGGAEVNGIDIIATDIETENGVIHLIDGVLLESLDVVERAIVTPATSTLVSAVVAGQLVETLQGEGPFTVFAPTNDAFAAIPDAVLSRLLDPANRAILQKVLTYHVIPGEVRAADLVDGATPATVEGSEVTIDLTGTPQVNGANIVATDITTENGVIHLIDEVLLDNLDIVDQAILNGFGTLVGAVQAADLEATLRTDNGGAGFTVFAPTDAAFAALDAIPEDPAVLTQVLLYHVVGATVNSGDLTDGQVVTTLQGGTFTVRFVDGGVRLEGANNTVDVIVTDVAASNGVIHVIDAVLLP